MPGHQTEVVKWFNGLLAHVAVDCGFPRVSCGMGLVHAPNSSSWLFTANLRCEILWVAGRVQWRVAGCLKEGGMWSCWAPNEVACLGFVEVREPKWYDLVGEAVEMETKGRNAAGEIARTGAIELGWRCSDELLLASFSLIIWSCLQIWAHVFVIPNLLHLLPLALWQGWVFSWLGYRLCQVLCQGQSLHCILAWQAMISLTANPFGFCHPGLFFPD